MLKNVINHLKAVAHLGAATKRLQTTIPDVLLYSCIFE
ncbi:hypothetical protein PB1_12994 [Bacillus methanolicus PB1]|uniref:Uncharacterized protein n=1 Tax=Bacillus methanolicus PB1 TaxID=997296 RepID=I3DW54_BACMT|nr:hypothetical protein PB1_12994 [Bacillus methanolicus PB1]